MLLILKSSCLPVLKQYLKDEVTRCAGIYIARVKYKRNVFTTLKKIVDLQEEYDKRSSEAAKYSILNFEETLVDNNS